ncbi:MAG: WD40 repeat domain-containing protein [Chloroflexota bacterium]
MSFSVLPIHAQEMPHCDIAHAYTFSQLTNNNRTFYIVNPPNAPLQQRTIPADTTYLTPEWSSGGGYIVYPQGYDSIIYSTNGTEPLLTITDEPSSYITWHPTIDYLLATAIDTTVFTIDVRTSEQQQITEMEVSNGYIGIIEWSPNGRYLAWVHFYERSSNTIYVHDTETDTTHTLADSNGFPFPRLWWSANDAYLLLALRDDDTAYSQLWFSETGELENLTLEGVMIARWTSNHRGFVFSTYDNFIYGYYDSEARRTLYEIDRIPDQVLLAWGANNTTWVYSRPYPTSVMQIGNRTLTILQGDQSPLTAIDLHPLTSTFSVSPDGQYFVAYQELVEEENATMQEDNMQIYNTAGTLVGTLRGQMALRPNRWTPDSQFLAYLQEERYFLYNVRTRQSCLANNGIYVSSWSPYENNN